jgi:lysophospholipid acyltransferase (LPLAT)-like uncharacterized protein
VKRFLRSEGMQRVLAALIAAYSWVVYRLTRWTRVNTQHFETYGREGKPFIVCFWHGRMILLPNVWQFRMQLYLLGSHHRDARLIGRALGHFGVLPIIGSSSRGGAQAFREMARRLREKSSVCITPDGPRGPRMHVGPGIVTLAKLAGAPIIPIAFSVTRGKVLDTWDRFLFAYPFGRGVFIGGEPIFVARDADERAMEAARLRLETMLNDITAEADRRCGRTPIEPAPDDGETRRLAETRA